MYQTLLERVKNKKKTKIRTRKFDAVHCCTHVDTVSTYIRIYVQIHERNSLSC